MAGGAPLSTGRSLFVAIIYDVIKQSSRTRRPGEWDVWRGFDIDHANDSCSRGKEIKRHCRWRLALLHLGHFPISPGGSKTDDPIGAGVGPSPPKKEALSSLHIASSGLRQIPPIPPRWPQLCIRFSSHQAVFGLLSLGGGKFPRLCHRATCDQHATPQVQDERGASEEQPSDAHQCYRCECVVEEEEGRLEAIVPRHLDILTTRLERDELSPRSHLSSNEDGNGFSAGFGHQRASGTTNTHLPPILHQHSGFRISIGTPRNSGSRACPASGTPPPHPQRRTWSCTASDPSSLCARRVAGP